MYEINAVKDYAKIVLNKGSDKEKAKVLII